MSIVNTTFPLKDVKFDKMVYDIYKMNLKKTMRGSIYLSKMHEYRKQVSGSSFNISLKVRES